MKIMFYKAFQSEATLLDKIIAIFSVGKYSHVEIAFSNGDFFSVSARDGGARFKKINVNPENWDALTLNITEEEEEYLRGMAIEYYSGLEYDYIGALFSISPICIHKLNKMFCSELVVSVLKNIETFKFLQRGCTYSPNRLYKEIKKIKEIKK